MAAYGIAKAHNDRITSEEPFSKMIRENIEIFYPTQNANSKLLAEIKRSRNLVGGGPLPLTAIDVKFREELQRQFLRNLIEKTAKGKCYGTFQFTWIKNADKCRFITKNVMLMHSNIIKRPQITETNKALKN